MEPDPGKIKDINNIKQIWKRNKKNESVMPVHVEYAKGTFNVLALLTKTAMYFSLLHRYSKYYLFSFFINRNFSLRIHTADIISL